MSGHSGFQPIGNNLPPIIPQPQVGDVRGPGQAPQSQPPAVSGGDDSAQDYNVRKEAAEALSRKLDTMLLQAAKLSTRTVDDASLKSAMDAAHLGKADRKDLADAAKKAMKAMKAVSEFSGRQIAAALVAGKDGFLDWKAGDPVAKAIVAAIDAQAELSIRLTDIANSLADSPDVADGDAFDALSELALQCDRRQSEIFNLAMELADAVRNKGDDPALAARLDAKLSALLPSQAVLMHGNVDVIDKLKAQLQPLAGRLEAFAARPAASITSAEFTAYAAEVKNASAAISRALKEGFPAPGGGRFRPDRAFMASLAALARFAEGKLANVRKTVGEARLRDFANRVIGLPENIPIFDPENLADLGQYAPALVKIVKLRRQLRDALLADLARRLPAAALDSARKRLDEAIAHAEKLAGEGKVVRNEDFSRQDVQKRLLRRELDAPSNPVKPVNGKSPFSSKDDIVKKAARQTRSLFFRDLFEHLEKKGWFA